MKKSKIRFILTLIMAVVMSVCMSISTFASTNADVNANLSIEVEDAYSFATEFLSDFYNGAHYVSEECDLSKYISNESFLEYMKEVYRGESSTFSPGSITDHHVDFTLKSSKAIDNHIWLEVVTNIGFKYIDSDIAPNVKDTVELIIGLDNGSYVIKDYYMTLWDSAVRGGITSIDSPYFWDDSAKAEAVLTAKKNIVEERKQFDEAVDARSDELAKTANTKGKAQIEASPFRIFFLNKANMVNWARANYNATILTSGNSELLSEFRELYDPNHGNYDCTNFASHAVLAGGAPMYDDNRPGYSSGWFCRDDGYYTRSTSWASVVSFHKFLINNTTKGPRGRSIDYVDITNGEYKYEIGDFVQYYDGVKWCHTAIIVGFKNKDNGSTDLIPIVCYRSSPESCGDQLPYNYRSGVTAYRIIKMDGYYK